MKAATPFDDKLMRRVIILEPGNRRFEVTRVGKAVRANRAAVRQGEFGPVILANIAARHLRIGADLGHHAPRQHGNMPGWHKHSAHFGKNVQRAAFRDNQHFGIGIQQYAIGHVFIKSVKAGSHAKMLTRIAGAGHGPDTVDEIAGCVRCRQRVPSILSQRQVVRVAIRRRLPQRHVNLCKAPGMPDRRTNPIQP